MEKHCPIVLSSYVERASFSDFMRVRVEAVIEEIISSSSGMSWVHLFTRIERDLLDSLRRLLRAGVFMEFRESILRKENTWMNVSGSQMLISLYFNKYFKILNNDILRQ